MSLEHVISADQFLDLNTLNHLFELAKEMEAVAKSSTPSKLLEGKISASLFYEPSTRTRFSFETAMRRLGGQVITTEAAGMFSSVSKGETLEDTIKVISGYADCIVMRHNEIGAAKRAAEVSSVPVINAGDGAGEHPTQALLDIYTIQKEKSRIEGLTIALVGDLLYGRTIHSLIPLLSIYSGIKLVLVSPKELALPQGKIAFLKEKNIHFTTTTDLNENMDAFDVVYMTRIQKERFSDPKEYERLKDVYTITQDTVRQMKEDAIIMHPLPRVGEISPEIDSDPRAAYFRQAQNGVYIRMALLSLVLKAHHE